MLEKGISMLEKEVSMLAIVSCCYLSSGKVRSKFGNVDKNF